MRLHPPTRSFRLLMANPTMIVARLSEQNGERGRIKLEQKVRLLNMLEETQQETDVIEYSPFEIITIGFEK